MLAIGGVRVDDLAAEYGTPLFIYDEEHSALDAERPSRRSATASHTRPRRSLCQAMARLAHEEGMHLDVATGGELHIALGAGVPAERLVMHGNNKSDYELDRRSKSASAASSSTASMSSNDSRYHAATGVVAPVLLRVTPGVEAHTHEFIATGQDDSKFGFTVSTGVAQAAVDEAIASPAVDLLGIHAHIGSQVFRLDSFRAAAQVLAEFSNPLGLPELSVGGGWAWPTSMARRRCPFPRGARSSWKRALKQV